MFWPISSSTLFTGSWWLSATTQGVCHWPCAHRHTQTEASLPLTHTPDNVSLSPCHTTLGPASLCPRRLPLHHRPRPARSVCADKHVRVCSYACVCRSVSAHTSPSAIWNTAVSARSVYLDSSAENLGRCRWKKQIASETQHANRSQAKWPRHALDDICGLHACTADPSLHLKEEAVHVIADFVTRMK